VDDLLSNCPAARQGPSIPIHFPFHFGLPSSTYAGIAYSIRYAHGSARPTADEQDSRP
jgi:hypothetical protein